jgi:hypothetical protein
MRAEFVLAVPSYRSTRDGFMLIVKGKARV